MLTNFYRIGLLIVALATLMACNSSSDPEPAAEVLTGVLVDNPVVGVAFSTTTQDGITNDLGEFHYLEGETVTFSIGNIELGSASGAPIITPVALTGSSNPTDSAALNQLVFLQSIDENSNPDDGIVITGAARSLAADVSLNFSSATFATDVAAVVTQITGGANTVVSDEDALAHFFMTYQELGGVDVLGFDFPDAGGDGTVPSSDWVMVWNDEFDGTEIDMTKWSHEVNCDGGGNNEQQCYTANPENSFVEDGILKIVALPATGEPLPYSSARLRTLDKGDWTYGRFEVRAKPPIGQGSWPAIWMLPTDWVYGGWAASGEIDIFESVNLKTVDNQGVEEATVVGTLWYGGAWPNQSHSGVEYDLPDEQNPADDFHTYALEWEEGEMRWYVDDFLYSTQRMSEVSIDGDGDAAGLVHKGWYQDLNGQISWTNAPYDERFHLLLNFAVGGDWPANVNNLGIDASAYDGTNVFEIDYVRVYECSVDLMTGQGCASVYDGYLEPIGSGGTLREGNAPAPVKPSSGEATDYLVFENEENPNWPAWNCCGESTLAVVTDDAEHGEVVEFALAADPTVVGFNTTLGVTPEPYDGSPALSTGTLEFDLKLVTPPIDTSAPWWLKVEQNSATTEANIPIETPTSEWQHYSVAFNTLAADGLDLNGIDLVMFFPAWGQGEGAVYRVDNVTFLGGDGGGDTGGDEVGPFNGIPASIPGVIEAEDFDLGPAGESYSDADVGNNGGQYRALSDVDIEASSAGGFNVGWIADGEYLDYSVDVANAGDYIVDISVASPDGGGVFHLEFDGVDVSGPINVPATGDWQAWTTVTVSVTLNAGEQEMRFVADSADDANFNLDFFNLTAD